MVNPKRSLTTSSLGGYFGTRRLDSEGNCSGSRCVAVEGVAGGEPGNGEDCTSVSGGPSQDHAGLAGSDGQTGTDERFGDYEPRTSASRQARDSFKRPRITVDAPAHDQEQPLVIIGPGGEYVKKVYDPSSSVKCLAWVGLFVLLAIVAAALIVTQ